MPTIYKELSNDKFIRQSYIKFLMQQVRVKSPLEKIITILKERYAGDSKVDEAITLVQKFAQEIELEKANAIIQIVMNCHSMDRVEFYRGKIDAYKKLQRDFIRE